MLIFLKSLFFTIIFFNSFAQVVEMVVIPAGNYQPLYRDSLNIKTKKIAVSSFEMDIYPVTNQDFLKFVKKYPQWKKSKVKKLFVDENYLSHWINDTAFTNLIVNSPVTNISWFAAKEYCKCQGKRLPTINEWEYVAAASKKSQDGAEDKQHNQQLLDWYSKPNPKQLPNVGSTFKNYYGIYDIHGLIWEWVADFYTILVTGESRGDSELNKNLFCGSGSIGSSDFKNYAAFLRFGFRSSLKANYGISNLGFRCVKN